MPADGIGYRLKVQSAGKLFRAERANAAGEGNDFDPVAASVPLHFASEGGGAGEVLRGNAAGSIDEHEFGDFCFGQGDGGLGKRQEERRQN